MAGTTVLYNGVTIHNVMTESINQTAFMDATNSDQVATTLECSFVGILHKKINFIAQAPIGVSVASSSETGDDLDLFRETMEALNTTRRQFKYSIGSEVIWDIYPIFSDAIVNFDATDGRFDIRNGPIVNATVLRVIGQHSAWVRFTIKTTYLNCASSSRYSNNILSMRWSMADDIDTRNWLTTRVYEGQIEVVSRQFSPHFLRYVTLPPLLWGFKRDAISFTESEDGLKLKFRIVDREVYAQAPFPASDWRGTFRVGAAYGGAGAKDADMSIELVGPKNVSKLVLLTQLFWMIDAKFDYLRLLRRNALFPTYIEFSELLEENVVSANIKLRYYDDPGMVAILRSTFGHRFEQDSTGRGLPGYNSQMPTYQWPSPHTLAGVFVPAVQNPCYPNTGFPIVQYQPPAPVSKIRESPGGGPGGGSGYDPADPGPEFTNTFMDRNSPYLRYRLASAYDVAEGVYSFPLSYTDDEGRTQRSYRLHPPIASRTITCEGQRINKWPVMPNRESWYDTDTKTNYTLRSYTPNVPAVDVSADGKDLLYTSGVTATWDMDKPPSDSELLKIGRLPYILQGSGLDRIVWIDPAARVGAYTFDSLGGEF